MVNAACRLCKEGAAFLTYSAIYRVYSNPAKILLLASKQKTTGGVPVKVPAVGVEPTRPQGARDFESRASANSATLANSPLERALAIRLKRLYDES